jgi:hypothetical protein
VKSNERFLYYLKKNTCDLESSADVEFCAHWAEKGIERYNKYLADGLGDAELTKKLANFQVRHVC